VWHRHKRLLMPHKQQSIDQSIAYQCRSIDNGRKDSVEVPSPRRLLAYFWALECSKCRVSAAQFSGAHHSTTPKEANRDEQFTKFRSG
jgi:hypothetical protein